MASIYREVSINAPASVVWDVIRDVGAVHKRLVPGLVVDAYRNNEKRVVTFSNGRVVHELIVAIDDDLMRFAYASVGGLSTHHNASMQVFAEGEACCRLVWITDVLPNEVVPPILQLVEQAMPLIKQTLESSTENA